MVDPTPRHMSRRENLEDIRRKPIGWQDMAFHPIHNTQRIPRSDRAGTA